MKARFTLFFLFLAICFTYSQNFNTSSQNLPGAEIIKNFYPLDSGDSWKYYGPDTTFSGDFYANIYIMREVVGDTLMPNGVTYKKIGWSRADKNPAYPPQYEYNRKDAAGNVYIYYEGADYILYDFTKNKDSVYQSHLPGKFWKVRNKTSVNYFGINREVIQLELRTDSSDYPIKIVEFAENLGLTSYGPFYLGTFRWNSINICKANVSDVEYKITEDYSEFYPLHVGDFRVYDHSYYWQGYSFYFKTIERVTKDSIFADGEKYYLMDGTFVRIDSLGNIFEWMDYRKGAERIFSLFVPLNHAYSSQFHSNTVKGETEIAVSKWNNMDNWTFTKGKGLTRTVKWSFATIYSNLVGGSINGVVWGDTTLIGVEDGPENIVADYKLDQNYPNPFNPTTNISFDLPKESFVSLTIYNILGEKIETLVNEIRRAGSHTVTFDAHNLPSGVYIYKITAGSYQASHKMLLMK